MSEQCDLKSEFELFWIQDRQPNLLVVLVRCDVVLLVVEFKFRLFLSLPDMNLKFILIPDKSNALDTCQ